MENALQMWTLQSPEQNETDRETRMKNLEQIF